jgi:hypothetical protein
MIELLMDDEAANAAGLIVSVGAAIFLVLAGCALLVAAW